MTKQQKITLSAWRDIPLNKLVLSQSKVRHVKAGVSIEELAEDIARRTLLASITVRPVLDDNGAETGMFTIPAGGRRFRALELLVKPKRLYKTALVPCVLRMDGLAEVDSLAENIQRAPLHPLDQFHPFQAMREKGRTEEEIAAAFFVSASVVKQRLKLAAIAPSLLDAYAEEEMTLDQLMAFTVNPDHARQEQAWEALQRHYSRQDDGLKPLSDRLIMELTAHRTLAQDQQVAFLAALHAMTLRLFYRYGLDSCVEIEPHNAAFGSQVPGLGDTAYSQAIDQRHETWARNLPKASEDLWEALTDFDSCSREALFAHCVAMSVNAVHDPNQRRPRAIAHADVLTGTVGLDMSKAGRNATPDSYLGRVTKARILDAVREAKGEDAADRITGLKKAEMVTAAEDLLVGTGWLSASLRTPRLPEEDAAEFELVDKVDEPFRRCYRRGRRANGGKRRRTGYRRFWPD